MSLCLLLWSTVLPWACRFQPACGACGLCCTRPSRSGPGSTWTTSWSPSTTSSPRALRSSWLARALTTWHRSATPHAAVVVNPGNTSTAITDVAELSVLQRCPSSSSPRHSFAEFSTMHSSCINTLRGCAQSSDLISGTLHNREVMSSSLLALCTIGWSWHLISWHFAQQVSTAGFRPVRWPARLWKMRSLVRKRCSQRPSSWRSSCRTAEGVWTTTFLTTYRQALATHTWYLYHGIWLP